MQSALVSTLEGDQSPVLQALCPLNIQALHASWGCHYKIPTTTKSPTLGHPHVYLPLGPLPPPAGASTVCGTITKKNFFWPFYPLFCTPTRNLFQQNESEAPGCTTKLMSKLHFSLFFIVFLFRSSLSTACYKYTAYYY